MSGATEVIIFPIKLLSLNEYITAERTNRYQSAKIKRHIQDTLRLFIHHAVAMKTLHRHENKCSLYIEWWEENNRRDNDNVAFAIKFIQDALVEYGIFPDDSRKYIEGLYHEIFTDKKNPRIVVHILEGEDRPYGIFRKLRETYGESDGQPGDRLDTDRESDGEVSLGDSVDQERTAGDGNI